MSAAITSEVIQQHQLTPAEYCKIVDILGRKPTYTELGIFSVMWSEHCGYKFSRPVLAAFKRYIENPVMMLV